MSFGWGAGDIIAGINMVQTVIRAVKDGPAEYREIHRELLSLIIALKSVQESMDDPVSLLNRKGKSRKQELQDILTNCRKVVDEVQSLINKHSRLQTRGRGIRRVWDAYRVGSADLDTLRGRLTLYASMIDMFLHSLEGPALARIEGMVRNLVTNMGITPNVAGSSRMSIASVASTATILSILDPDQEGEAWKFLRAELMADGILPSHLATYKMEIIGYMKTLIAGVEDPEASPRSNEAIAPVEQDLWYDSVSSPTSLPTVEKNLYEVKTEEFGLFTYKPAVVRHGVTPNERKSALLFCVEVSSTVLFDNLASERGSYYFTLEAGTKSRSFAPAGHFPEAGLFCHTYGLTWKLWQSVKTRQSFSEFRLSALFDMGTMRVLNELVTARISLLRVLLQDGGKRTNICRRSTVEFAIRNETFQQFSPTVLEAQDLVNAASGA